MSCSQTESGQHWPLPLVIYHFRSHNFPFVIPCKRCQPCEVDHSEDIQEGLLGVWAAHARQLHADSPKVEAAMCCILIIQHLLYSVHSDNPVPPNSLVMLRTASAALVGPVTRVKVSPCVVGLVPTPRQISQVLLTAATISILGSSHHMSAAAASPAGECANPQGPVPEKIQNLASEVLKVRPTTPS